MPKFHLINVFELFITQLSCCHKKLQLISMAFQRKLFEIQPLIHLLPLQKTYVRDYKNTMKYNNTVVAEMFKHQLNPQYGRERANVGGTED